MLDLWHLQNCDCLRALDASDQEMLRHCAQTFQVRANELVFEPTPNPHHVYVLEAGLIKIYRESSQAGEAVLGYIRPGEVFGELTLFSAKPRESFASALVNSNGLKIPRDKFRQALGNSPAATLSIAGQIEGRFKEVSARVEDLVFRNVRSRLARILLQLSTSFGELSDGVLVIQRRFTQKELAGLIGASRPSISLALGELEDEGVISRSSGLTAIKDRDKLNSIAEQTG